MLKLGAVISLPPIFILQRGLPKGMAGLYRTCQTLQTGGMAQILPHPRIQRDMRVTIRGDLMTYST